MVVLCGLGGAGKTSVAVEYAHRHLAGLGVVWQFPAEEPATLAAAFSDLAAALGARDLLDAGDPVAAVHGALAAWPRAWLLVFDNATGLAAVQGLLPSAGNGRVLVTSKSVLWPPGQVLDVPVLDVDTAAAFLVNRTGAAMEGEAARELAGELGGLPLALEQAAAYMQVTGRSISGYLELFRQRSLELLSCAEVAGYGKQVTTTWALALDQISQAAPRAATLLRLLACCAPEAVPLGLLLNPRPENAEPFHPEVGPLLEPLLADLLAVDDAVAVLCRYSLTSPPHDGAVSVHRLVQAVTVAQLPGEIAAAWRQAAADLIETALPSEPDQPANWPAYAALLPHARAALATDSAGISLIARYLGNIGNYDAARDLYQQVLEAREHSRGAEEPGTLFARGEVAYWTGKAGDAAGARDQLAALLPVAERVLGPEHPDSLRFRGNLARWTGEAGDAAGARDQFAALLPVRERVLGPEHPSTLITRHNLAYYVGEAGDAAGARDQLAALLPVRERILGPEHPETLSTQANLAYWTREARGGSRFRRRKKDGRLITVRCRSPSGFIRCRRYGSGSVAIQQAV